MSNAATTLARITCARTAWRWLSLSNPNKRKGTAWESAVRDFALKCRLKAFRPAQAGAADVGDVHIAGQLCVQAKDTASHRFGEWLSDAAEQAVNAGLPFPVVVAKRRRASVADAYAVMTLETLMSITRRLDMAERLLAVSTAAPHYRRFLDEENES